MRSASLRPLVLVALAALATACGASADDTGAPPSLQGSLRALAGGAPSGDRAYWLGPAFHRAPVSFADASWGRSALLTYHRRQDVDIDVESFASRATGAFAGVRVRARTPSGQDVVLIFRQPAHPDAALMRAAKAALRPIPLRVTYP
jgi:hypothetical protein